MWEHMSRSKNVRTKEDWEAMDEFIAKLGREDWEPYQLVERPASGSVLIFLKRWRTEDE